MKRMILSLLAFTLFSTYASAGCNTHHDYYNLFGNSRTVKRMLKDKGYKLTTDVRDLDYSIYVKNYLKRGVCNLVVTVGYIDPVSGQSMLSFYSRKASPRSLVICPNKKMLEDIASELPACE